METESARQASPVSAVELMERTEKIAAEGRMIDMARAEIEYDNSLTQAFTGMSNKTSQMISGK